MVIFNVLNITMKIYIALAVVLVCMILFFWMLWLQGTPVVGV